MSDQESLEEQFIFGAEAEKVLNNKAFEFAITAIKGQILNDLQTIAILDETKDKRDEYIRTLQNVNKIIDELTSIMENGKYAGTLLERETKINRR
jgi:hypothetical protein